MLDSGFWGLMFLSFILGMSIGRCVSRDDDNTVGTVVFLILLFLAAILFFAKGHISFM